MEIYPIITLYLDNETLLINKQKTVIMKFVQRLIVLICCFMPIALMAQSVEGTWRTSLPTEDGGKMMLQVEMKADGTYAVDFGGDGTIEINGKYELSGGKMTIQDTGGPNACAGAKGVYSVQVTDKSMTMTRQSDECEGRGGPEGVMSWTKV